MTKMQAAKFWVFCFFAMLPSYVLYCFNFYMLAWIVAFIFGAAFMFVFMIFLLTKYES